MKTAFGINFGLLEVLERDNDYDDDDDDDYDDNDDYDVLSSSQRISHTICTRGEGHNTHFNYDDDNCHDGHHHDHDNDDDNYDDNDDNM